MVLYLPTLSLSLNPVVLECGCLQRAHIDLECSAHITCRIEHSNTNSLFTATMLIIKFIKEKTIATNK